MTTLTITSTKTDITNYLSTKYVSLLQNIGNNIVSVHALEVKDKKIFAKVNN